MERVWHGCLGNDKEPGPLNRRHGLKVPQGDQEHRGRHTCEEARSESAAFLPCGPRQSEPSDEEEPGGASSQDRGVQDSRTHVEPRDETRDGTEQARKEKGHAGEKKTLASHSFFCHKKPQIPKRRKTFDMLE